MKMKQDKTKRASVNIPRFFFTAHILLLIPILQWNRWGSWMVLQRPWDRPSLTPLPRGPFSEPFQRFEVTERKSEEVLFVEEHRAERVVVRKRPLPWPSAPRQPQFVLEPRAILQVEPDLGRMTERPLDPLSQVA